MDVNIAIIIFGCIIVVVALIIVLRSGNKEDDVFTDQLISGLVNENNDSRQNTLNHEKIIQGLEGLNNEIGSIKEQIDRLTALVDGDNDEMVLSPSTNHEWENFEHSLNYNMFAQKNSDIIKSYQQGQSTEEIAKRLNKSVREVEMVIKLIK